MIPFLLCCKDNSSGPRLTLTFTNVRIFNTMIDRVSHQVYQRVGKRIDQIFIKVGFFTSICVTFPILSIQIWKFIAPALYKNEKSAFLPFLIATPVLFTLGAAMVYYIVTPMAWNFFVGFEMAGSEGALAIEIEPRISEYLSLIMRLIFAFGLAFELPVVLLLLVRAGLVSPEGLAEKRKFAIVIAFVAAAILTPPDVVSQLMLALPIIALYEISIFGAKIIAPKPTDEAAE